MSKNFASMEELMAHNEGVLIIDLLDKALSIDDDECLDALHAPEKGIWIPGRLEPILKSDQTYCWFNSNESQIERISPEDILVSDNWPHDIYTLDDRRILEASRFGQLRKYMTDKPKAPVMVIRVLACLVREYVLKQTSQVPVGTWFIDTKLRDGSGATAVDGSLYSLVQPEYHYLIEREAYETLAGDLLDQVREFIGNDTMNIYRCYLKNSALHIVKGVDWRIFSYHQQQFTREEEERELSGIR